MPESRPTKPDLSRIRHELRTPINHILGYCEMLLEETGLPGEFRADLDRIHAGGRQLLRLMTRYFDDGQFADPREDLQRLYHDLRTPVNHIVGYSQLLQELAVEMKETRYVADLERIHRAAGTWLALTEVYLLPVVGTVTEGVGTPMRMEAASPVPTLTARNENLVPDRGRILVTDDDAGNRDMLIRRLRRHGYEVGAAESGMQALQLLRNGTFDLLLLDLLMPEMDGHQVLAELKRDPALCDLPVIMLSALDQETEIARCIEMGADDYLTKPFNPVFLRARIGACLEKKRLRDRERQTHRALVASQDRVLAELAEAGAYVQSILPPPLCEGPVRADWCFKPSAQLGGDAFGYHWLDEYRFAFYLLDVSGHGVAAALLSVSALNLLRSGPLWRGGDCSPADVLSALNEVFPMERHNQQYFTAWVGVYDLGARRLEYASAGHPPALLVTGGCPGEFTPLRTSAPPVGAFPDAAFTCRAVDVPCGAELFVLSDGVYEIPLPDGRTGTLDDLISVLRTGRCRGADTLAAGLAWARSRAPQGVLDDDFSLLRIRFPG